MDINIPEVHAEVEAAFWAYEKALIDNDIDIVKDLFWDSEHTLRYGIGENLYGMAEIDAFREGQRGHKLEREVTKLVVTTYGRDYGTANCETRRTGSGPDAGTVSRQSHTWVRLPEGWKIVAAHVSLGPKSG